jgi:hypothetical protein
VQQYKNNCKNNTVVDPEYTRGHHYAVSFWPVNTGFVGILKISA